MKDLKRSLDKIVLDRLCRILVWLSLGVLGYDLAGLLLAHPFLPWPLNALAAVVLVSRAAVAVRLLF